MIITIGREYGSGGRHVGQKLAEKLGIKYYDKNSLAEEAKKNPNYDELKNFYEEEQVNSLLHMIAISSNAKGFKVPFSFIREIAEKEDCVIIGRCGNFILRNNPDMVSVFIYSDVEKRTHRVAEYENIKLEKARARLEKVDMERQGFHKYYTGEFWKNVNGYELCINSNEVGIDGAVDMIIDFIEKRKNFKAQNKDF
ncbi:cytidylate kinase-like family protein [Lachnospiraceae bacterium ZAX-1]